MALIPGLEVVLLNSQYSQKKHHILLTLVKAYDPNSEWTRKGRIGTDGRRL